MSHVPLALRLFPWASAPNREPSAPHQRGRGLVADRSGVLGAWGFSTRTPLE